VLDADEMRMPNMRTGIMYFGDRGMRQLDVQGLRMRSWNGGRLLDVEHMVNRLHTTNNDINIRLQRYGELYEIIRNYKNVIGTLGTTL